MMYFILNLKTNIKSRYSVFFVVVLLHKQVYLSECNPNRRGKKANKIDSFTLLNLSKSETMIFLNTCTANWNSLLRYTRPYRRKLSFWPPSKIPL